MFMTRASVNDAINTCFKSLHYFADGPLYQLNRPSYEDWRLGASPPEFNRRDFELPSAAFPAHAVRFLIKEIPGMRLNGAQPPASSTSLLMRAILRLLAASMGQDDFDARATSYNFSHASALYDDFRYLGDIYRGALDDAFISREPHISGRLALMHAADDFKAFDSSASAFTRHER